MTSLLCSHSKNRLEPTAICFLCSVQPPPARPSDAPFSHLLPQAVFLAPSLHLSAQRTQLSGAARAIPVRKQQSHQHCVCQGLPLVTAPRRALCRQVRAQTSNRHTPRHALQGRGVPPGHILAVLTQDVCRPLLLRWCCSPVFPPPLLLPCAAMVMEPADHRVRGPQQHPPPQPYPPQQPNWPGAMPAAPYHMAQQGRQQAPPQQQQQMPRLMVMQPGGAAFANGPYGPIPIAFQGPVLFAAVNGAVPAHLMAMHATPHHMWPAGQQLLQHQHHLQQQQAQLQAAAAAAAARRARQGAAPNQQQQPAGAGPSQRPGALHLQQQAAGAGAGAAAAPSAAAALSKSAAVAMLQQGGTSGTALQARNPGLNQLVAGAAAGAGGSSAGGGPDSMDIDDTASICTETGDWAESNELPAGDGSSESSWAWLVDGVLQQVSAGGFVCLCAAPQLCAGPRSWWLAMQRGPSTCCRILLGQGGRQTMRVCLAPLLACMHGP